MKKILLAWLLALIAPFSFGQSYPSPTYQNLLVNGTFNSTGLVSCNSSSSAVTWNAGSFGCNTSILANNVSGIVTVPHGGTGLATLTAHGVLLGEGTSNVTFAGPNANSNYALLSTGSSTDPTFQQMTAPMVNYTPTQTGGTTSTVAATLAGQCLNANTGFGANGTAGDGGRIQNALNAAQPSNGGPGCVWFPAIGKPYLIDAGVTVPGGVAMYGAGASNFQGLTATVAQWTALSTWFECTDTVNPCVSIVNHGITFDGINMIWNQVVPTTGTYVPAAFPDGLYITGTFFRIRNSVMVGGTRCVNVNYTSGSGGGTYSEMQNLKLGCISTDVRMQSVNDVVYVNDVDARPLWYITNASLLTYTEANLVGWDINYWDNAVVKGVQCLFTYACMKFTNGTALSITHSFYFGQISHLDCNLVRICMLANSNPVVAIQADGVFAQQDTGSGLSDTLFQLNSDNVDVNISSLYVVTAGGSIMTIGGGTAGYVNIGQLTAGTNVNGSNVYGYSSLVGGQTGFSVAAGAHLSIGRKKVIRNFGVAGSFIAGAGVNNVNMPTYCWPVYATFGQQSITGNGTVQTFTTDNQTYSNQYGNFTQGRLIGQFNVTTSQAGGSAIFTAANFTPVTATVPATATGAQNFDSNWVEVNDSGQIVGRIEQQMTNGVVGSFGDLTFCGR